VCAFKTPEWRLFPRQERRHCLCETGAGVPENIVSATRIVVFLKSEALVNQLTVSCIWVKEAFVPLSAPATKVTISNVPPFVSNDVITKELQKFGNIAGPARV